VELEKLVAEGNMSLRLGSIRTWDCEKKWSKVTIGWRSVATYLGSIWVGIEEGGEGDEREIIWGGEEGEIGQ
jgi:hypothetical protein